ncbi:MAG: GAF and ANTAR domain-containing protein [Acidimicrobiales bacterium]
MCSFGRVRNNVEHMGDDAEPDLAATFASVARELRAEAPSVQATLERMVRLAVETIEGCDHAGISYVEGRRITTPAASDEIPGKVDAIQYEVDEGPCLDAIREHEMFQTDDLTLERRWPRFSQRVVRETGVVSMLSFRLFVDEDTLGGLNLHSKKKAAFDADDRAVGSVFAAHAAIALSAAVKQQQLEEAVQTRDVIGQAKGILMARQSLTAEQAFDILRRASQRLNIKLKEVADRVAAQAPSQTKPDR